MKNVTLTISGGGIRSTASLGVLKYLEEKDIHITALSGSSGGAIIALLYSYGFSLSEIEDFYYSIRKFDIFRPSFNSLFSLNKLEKKLRKFIGKRERVKELIVCATDLVSGEPVYFKDGDLIEETIASASLIPFFGPVKINGKYYVDGGYSDNLPNKPFLKNKELNVSVNVNNVSKELSFKPKKLITRLLMTVMNSNIRCAAESADFYVNISTLNDIGLFSFDKFDYVVNQGYQHAERKLRDI